MPQRLAGLDHLLAPLHLERLFLGRHKFYHFRVWYRDQLSQYLKEILLDLRARHRPYLQGQVLVRVVDAHTRGRQNWTKEIHRVLSLELLQRQLIERWSHSVQGEATYSAPTLKDLTADLVWGARAGQGCRPRETSRSELNFA